MPLTLPLPLPVSVSKQPSELQQPLRSRRTSPSRAQILRVTACSRRASTFTSTSTSTSDRMQQAESQLQLRVQELESLRESLAEVQAAAAAVTSDRDALRQALSNQDKAMHAMKAYIGTIAATAATAAPSHPVPPLLSSSTWTPAAAGATSKCLRR